MTIVTLHTRLHPDALAAYDALHAAVPDGLLAALRDAGVRDWRIWRDGQDVFHLLDVDDYVAMRAALRDHPANVGWQAQVTPLQEVPDDYSGQDTGLQLVWSFVHQIGLPPDVRRDLSHRHAADPTARTPTRDAALRDQSS